MREGERVERGGREIERVKREASHQVQDVWRKVTRCWA